MLVDRTEYKTFAQYRGWTGRLRSPNGCCVAPLLAASHRDPRSNDEVRLLEKNSHGRVCFFFFSPFCRRIFANTQITGETLAGKRNADACHHGNSISHRPPGASAGGVPSQACEYNAFGVMAQLLALNNHAGVTHPWLGETRERNRMNNGATLELDPWSGLRTCPLAVLSLGGVPQISS